MHSRQECWLWFLSLGVLFSLSCAHRRITASAPSRPSAQTTAENGHSENGTEKRRAPWDPPDNPQARRAWFQARKRSAENLREMQASLGTALPSAAAPSTSTNPFQWTFIGPQPIGSGITANPSAGSVLTLAMDPHNSCFVYAGTYVGKLWKTADCGNTWQPLSDSGPLVQVQSISVDPVLANTLYVLDAGSIYKSTDGGLTWNELAPVVADASQGCSGDAFAIDPSVSGTWLVTEVCYSYALGLYSAIYRSTDGGLTWKQVAAPSVGLELYRIGFNRGNAAFAYASGVILNSQETQYATAFQTSSDSGMTWVNAPGSASLPSGSGYAEVVFAAVPSAPKTVYLLVESLASGLNLFKTVDQGVTWTALTSFPSGFPRPPGLVAVNPTNPNMVFAGATLLYGSTDGGQTWQSAGGTAPGIQLHVDNHALIFSPDGTRMYESNDGGVWTMQTGSSAGWVNLNAGFGTAEFYPGLGLDPSNIARTFGGTQDNGTLLYSGQLGWTYAGVCGDGFSTAINPTSSNIVYASCSGGFFRSLSGGAPASWTAAQNGLPPAIAAYPSFILDPATPTALYLFALPQTSTGQTIFQSLDGANSWHQVGPTFQSSIAAVAVAPSDSNTVVALDQSGNLAITTNALSGSASTWASYRAPAAALFDANEETGITIAPQNPKQIYLARLQVLFETLDGAMTWQAKNLANVTGNLNGLVVDPDIPNTLYLSTDSSVFRSSDGGATWYPLASGFPFVNVSSLTLHRASRTLRTGTIGRGAWDLAVPTTAPRVGSVSVAPAVPVPGVKLTVSGANFVSNSVIWMNGSPLATTFVNSAQLTATIMPGVSRNPNGNLIAVYTPGNAGGLSDPVSEIVPGSPVVSAVTPIFSTSGTIQPGEWVSIYGANLAVWTATWTGNFPTSLAGTSVTINAKAVYLSYVSPTQIDLQAPSDTATGPVPVVVTSPYGTGTSTVTLAPFAPAFSLLDTKHVAGIILRSDGSGAYGGGAYDILGPTGNSLGYATVAAKPGDTVELFGVGFGPTTPVVQAGQAFAGAATTAYTVNVLINNVSVAPLFAGLTSAGLYQINLTIPAGLGAGDVSLVATVGGVLTPAGVVISLLPGD